MPEIFCVPAMDVVISSRHARATQCEETCSDVGFGSCRTSIASTLWKMTGLTVRNCFMQPSSVWFR
jgi:hypothetical protein